MFFIFPIIGDLIGKKCSITGKQDKQQKQQQNTFGKPSIDIRDTIEAKCTDTGTLPRITSQSQRSSRPSKSEKYLPLSGTSGISI